MSAPRDSVVHKQIVPVHPQDLFLDLRRGHTRRIQAADDGSHAATGDVIDGDAQFLEHFEDADVRGASRAAAQHEANPRSSSGVFLFSADLRGMEKHHASDEAPADRASRDCREPRCSSLARKEGIIMRSPG